MDSNKAEEMFITHAQSVPDYGSHYYIATVDTKELEKLMAQQRKAKAAAVAPSSKGRDDGTDEKPGWETGATVYGKIAISHENAGESPPSPPPPQPPSMIAYADVRKLCRDEARNNGNNNDNNVNNNPNSVNANNNKNSGKKKVESNVWLAVHAQGLKLLERGGEPREKTELAHFQWRDVQTLSYNKSCLVVYSKLNGKRCKFKLRMDHRK